MASFSLGIDFPLPFTQFSMKSFFHGKRCPRCFPDSLTSKVMRGFCHEVLDHCSLV